MSVVQIQFDPLFGDFSAIDIITKSISGDLVFFMIFRSPETEKRYDYTCFGPVNIANASNTEANHEGQSKRHRCDNKRVNRSVSGI